MTQLFEVQLDMFRTLSSRALDSAGQIAALNVRATRASMEQATGTVKHLIEARDPRDLLALGSAAQGQWHTLFSYGRELFGLAVGARTLPAAIPLLAAPAPTANVPTSYTQVVDQVAIAAADATTIGTEIAAAAVDIGAAHAEAAIDAAAPAAPATERAAEPVSEPAAEPASEPQASAEAVAAAEAAIATAIADDVPPAEPNAVVKAINELSAKPAGAGHPLASTVPLEAEGQVELPPVAPPKASRASRKK